MYCKRPAAGRGAGSMTLIIDTGKLREKPESITGSEPAAAIDLPEGGDGALAYDLQVQRVSQELIVRGRLRIDLACRCARCGDVFVNKIRIGDFCRSYPLASKNELINLTDAVREDILLSLPMVAVCSAECKGLCSGCGVNLNRAQCSCGHPDKKNVWGVLDGLGLSGAPRDGR